MLQGQFFLGSGEKIWHNIETKNNDEFTPINNASTYGNLEVAKYIYENYHTDIDTKDNRGNTPVNSASKNGKHQVVKYLYETGLHM